MFLNDAFLAGRREAPLRFGIHVPKQRNLTATAAYASAIGCGAFQLFSGNPVGWRIGKLDSRDRGGFIEEVAASGLHPILVHAPYIVNLASPNAALRERGRRTLTDAIERAVELHAGPTVVHAGNHMGDGVAAGVSLAVEMIGEALDRSPITGRLAIEGGAGKGTEIGVTFGELRALVEPFPPNRVGIVLDTAHLWALGYDLRDRGAVAAMIGEFDSGPGLHRLWAIHANDSLAARGARRDRHSLWTEGRMGRPTLRNLVRAPELSELPVIFEVPGKTADFDRRRLASMRRLETRLHRAP